MTILTNKTIDNRNYILSTNEYLSRDNSYEALFTDTTFAEVINTLEMDIQDVLAQGASEIGEKNTNDLFEMLEEVEEYLYYYTRYGTLNDTNQNRLVRYTRKVARLKAIHV